MFRATLDKKLCLELRLIKSNAWSGVRQKAMLVAALAKNYATSGVT